MIDISKIRLNNKNPRNINDDKFKKLCNSIREFPKMLELRPIVIDKDGVILGGNMRYRALIHNKMQLREEWFREADQLTEDEQRRFIIEDNVGFGEWDWEVLANEWDRDELESWGMDVEQWKEEEVVEDEVPEVSQDEPISKLGEVYQLGRHRLMCGDSTKIEDVEKLMDGKKADFFFGDPPYGMRLDTDYSLMHSDNSMGYAKKHKKIIGDDADFDAGLVVPIVDSIKDQIWFGADYYAHSLGDTEHAGSWGVWDKRVEESQDAGFGSCFELFWSREKHKRMIYRFQWAGFFTKGEKREYDHPTSKSVKMISKLLEDYSNGNNILDLFLGSGSTLIACEQTNRTCYGMELDPKYCDVIRKRYAKFVNNEENWQDITKAI